jgi:hypothetical protein
MRVKNFNAVLWALRIKLVAVHFAASDSIVLALPLRIRPFEVFDAVFLEVP